MMPPPGGVPHDRGPGRIGAVVGRVVEAPGGRVRHVLVRDGGHHLRCQSVVQRDQGPALFLGPLSFVVDPMSLVPDAPTTTMDPEDDRRGRAAFRTYEFVDVEGRAGRITARDRVRDVAMDGLTSGRASRVNGCRVQRGVFHRRRGRPSVKRSAHQLESH